MKNLSFVFFILIYYGIQAQTVRLDSSNLPICIIDTRGKTILNEPKTLAHMKIIYSGPGKMNYSKATANHYNNFIAIEIRGNSSQSYPQKQYGIELRDSLSGMDIDTPILGMPNEEDWILYAPYNDISMLRNVFCYQLWREMGHWGPRTRFCELILNNEYQGIYILTESIKRGKDRVDISKLKEEDSSGLDVTGGYIMKIDKKNNVNDKSFISKVKSTNNQNVTWLYHYPDFDEIQKPQEDYIHNFIDSMEQTIAGSGFANPITGYQKYISSQSFIDYYLITEFSRNIDAYKASSYFYKEKLEIDGSKGKLKAGPVWDYNFAFGNASFCSGASFSGWMHDGCVPATLPTPILWRRLLLDSNYLNQVKCRYQELRKSIWDTSNLFKFLDNYAFDTLDIAQKRHFSKWKILGTNPGGFNAYIASSYPDEISRLKTWIKNRLSWMDSNLQGKCVQQPTAIGKFKSPLELKCWNPSLLKVDSIHPFNRTPFHYLGRERLRQIPSNIISWVLLELRSAKDSSIIIDRRAALLSEDSLLLDTNFKDQILFPNAKINEEYLIVVRYSPEVFVMSKTKFKLPMLSSLNLNTSQNRQIPDYNSPIIYNQSSILHNTIHICKGDSTIWEDFLPEHLKFSNLQRNFKYSGIRFREIDLNRFSINTRDIGEYTIYINYLCPETFIIRDSINIQVLSNPEPVITGNKIFCIGDSIQIMIKNFKSMQWNIGSTDSTIQVYSKGLYHVEVRDMNNCLGRDTVNIDQYPEISGELVSEYIVKEDRCRYYFISSDKSPSLMYQWSDGSGGDTLYTNLKSVELKVIDEWGCSKVLSKVCVPSGNEFIKSNHILNSFPNPVYHDWNVISNLDKTAHLRIVDLLGSLKLEIILKPGVNQIPLSNLIAGQYFIEVIPDHGEKIILEKLLYKITN